jgi:hypothetical protein
MILGNTKNLRTKVLNMGMFSNHGFKAVVNRQVSMFPNHGFKAVVNRQVSMFSNHGFKAVVNRQVRIRASARIVFRSTLAPFRRLGAKQESNI